jgi:putative ABC transport system permease protein
MDTLLRDFRYAIRTLAKSPGFALAAIATLALTIGVNTAVFSVVNEVVLKPLPFEDSDRLVWFVRESEDGREVGSISYPDYLEYRDRSEAFEELTAFSFLPLSTGSGDGSEIRWGQIVTGNYFAAFGVRAAHGRMLTVDDDVRPGGHPVVVVSHRYWQRARGGRPDVVGETVLIGGHPFTIVGIAPKGFAGAFPVPAPDLWVPMMMLEQARPEFSDELTDRRAGFLWVFGRLKPELSLPQTQAALAVTSSQLELADPDHYAGETASVYPSNGIIPMTPEMRRTALALSMLVMASVGLVLLVGCANVANLLLSRSTTRRREFGIRLALGAPRGRVVRQLLTEGFLLASIGGVVGLLLAVWSMDLIVAVLPQLPLNLSLELDFGIDGSVLAFTALVSLLAVLLFGLVPALASTRGDLFFSLKDEGGAHQSGWRRSRMRSALVVGQVAVSLVLLIGAALFMRSLLRAHAIDPGFRHEEVLAVTLDLGARGYDDASSKAFHDRLLERARTLPGTASASIDTNPPLGLGFSIGEVWIEDRAYADPNAEGASVANSTVSDGSFRTLSIPLLRGRDFGPQDTETAPKVVIVNEAFADRFWPGQDPLGKRISDDSARGPYMEVVGVVRTAKYWLIGEEPRPFVYLPLAQQRRALIAVLMVRTDGDPLAALPGVRAILQELDPDLTPWQTSRLTEMIGFALLPARFAAAAFGMFGVLALLLASVGLYGVMSYMVAQRTREVGVRVAIGAQRSDVLKLVLRQGLTLTAIGLGIGLVVAFACTRVLSGLLYEISAVDPVTFAGVSLLLVVIAMLACYIPARRATKIDPVVALRYE